MTNSESKYFNTAVLMDTALIHLLSEKDIEYISVKEICARAGVNRSTFYLHYETISDLLEETGEYINRQFLSSFDGSAAEFIHRINSASLSELVLINDDFLNPYLEFIREHKRVFQAVFRNPKCMKSELHLQNMRQHILKPIMNRFQIPEDEQHYRLSFYLNGIMAVIRDWIESNCADSTDRIKTIIINCVLPFHADHINLPGECP